MNKDTTKGTKLKFKGDPWDDPEQDGTPRHLKIPKRGKNWQEIKKERLWEDLRQWRLFIHRPV